MSKNNIVWLVVLVIMCGGSYYAGTKSVSKNASPNGVGARNFTGGANQFAGGVRANRGAGAGGGFVAGDVTAKDATSITVQLRNPAGMASSTANTGTGSKVIFVSATTQIQKTTAGTINDLSVGKQVTVQGTANTDGSIVAQTIQLR